MSTALSLVVIIAAGEAKDLVTTSMKKAAEETLGIGASVTVRDTARPLDDDDAVALEGSLHADAIAEITWRDSEHRHAIVHLHVRASSRWIDREIGFAASDAPSEQGRTIGFTVASMLPERPVEERASASPSSSRELPPSFPDASTRSESSGGAPRTWMGGIDASFLGAASLGGYGGGAGGALGLERYLGQQFAVRLGASARFSDVPVAQATSFMLTAGLGLAWRTHTPTMARRLALGARIDALVMLQSLTHLDDDDTSPAHQSRWLPGADAVVEGSWLFTEGASFVLGVGGEVAFGTTAVFAKRSQVANLSPFHPLLEAGFRARF